MNSSSCPGCRSCETLPLERVSIETLADHWSKLHAGAGDALLRMRSEGRIPGEAAITRCGECGLEYADPVFSVDSDWYEQFERYGARWEYQAALRLIPSRADILEVGCGDGRFLQQALKAGHRAQGIDFNASAIEVATRAGLRAEVADLREMQRVQGSARYDAVVAFHVIEHVERPVDFLKELAALTKPGGQVLLSCPGPRRFTTALETGNRAGQRDVWDYPPFHQTRWNTSALRAALRRAQWELERVEEEPFHWLGIAALLEPRHSRRSGSQFRRRLGLIARMARLTPARLRYKGMSILARARRASAPPV